MKTLGHASHERTVKHPRKAAPLLAALLATVALAACDNRADDETAGQKVDEAVAQAERSTEQARAEASKGLEQAKQTGSEVAQDIKAGASSAMEKTSAAVSDATITASVNAELAKDDKLSALKIDVDTSNGVVALKGTAPDAASRERATQLASQVKGVSSVDNQLKIANG